MHVPYLTSVLPPNLPFINFINRRRQVIGVRFPSALESLDFLSERINTNKESWIALKPTPRDLGIRMNAAASAVTSAID